MKNHHTIVIEGEDVSQEQLRVYVPENFAVDVVFVACDGQAPERVAVEQDKAKIARVVYAIDVATVAIELRKLLESRVNLVTVALDRIEPDTDLAIDAIEQMERDLRAAKARINGAIRERDEQC